LIVRSAKKTASLLKLTTLMTDGIVITVITSRNKQKQAPLRSVHAVLKTIRYSGASVYGGSSGRSEYNGDYATRSKLTIVGIARSTLSGD